MIYQNFQNNKENTMPTEEKYVIDNDKNTTEKKERNSNNHWSNSTNSSAVAVPPEVPGRRPIVGHLPVINKTMKELGQREMVGAFNRMFVLTAGPNSSVADTVSIDFPGVGGSGDKVFYMTSNADYATAINSDMEHFGKITHLDKRGGYYSARKVVGDALFTASDGESHAKSHRILMPAFSPRSLSSLVDITVLKTDQLLDRIGLTKDPFEIGETFTSVTFDIIGNYIGGEGLNFRTTEDPSRMKTDPFLSSMDVALNTKFIENNIDCGLFTNRTVYKERMEAINTLWDYTTQVITDRINGKTMSSGGEGNPDVLDRMLNTIDKETNEKMDIELVRNHLILFLLVGHDSTSSLLTSLMYVLSQNPEVEEKMRNEVNEVIGDEAPTMESIKKLTYTLCVIKETLRLYPPAGGLLKTCLKDTKLGPYQLAEGSKILVVTRELHRNKEYWGDDADAFDPERFMPNAPKAPKHESAWLPFSSGTRGCIGMQFSLIEARLILARIMQRGITFRLHKDAEVKEKYRTFMKLSNVMMTSHTLNNGSDTVSSDPRPFTDNITTTTTSPTMIPNVAQIDPHDGKINVYYGSNMETCEEIASSLCDEASRMGYDTSLNQLDDVVVSENGGFNDKGCINLIVTSTYNGQPPDNAKKFATYLKTLAPSSLSGIKFAICGVGNSNWKSYQLFPRSIADDLESAGATLICPRGIADEEKDLKSDVDAWRHAEFWPKALEATGLDPAELLISSSSDDGSKNHIPKLTVCETNEQATTVVPRSSGSKFATVISGRELQSSDSERSTRHVEFKLPDGMTYREGDHLAVYPENNPELVLRVATYLNEHNLGRTVLISSSDGSPQPRSMNHIPFDVPIRVSDLLSRHVDLQAPVSIAFVNAAAEAATSTDDRGVLNEISELMRDGVTTSDLQELRPAQILSTLSSIQMNLEVFLATVAPMKKRYYSISSSPSAVDSQQSPNIATVTVGLVTGTETKVNRLQPSVFGHNDTNSDHGFRGVSSGYLNDVRPGQLVEIDIVTNERFRLPKEPSTPVIMIGPGTGVAPFRGFYQAIEAENNNESTTPSPRPAMLFFGCRNEKDYLYRTEMESAPVELHIAFSRPRDKNSNTHKQYVQDLIWSNRENVWKYIKEENAYIYVCGDGRYMAKDVDHTLHRIAVECGKMSENDAIEFYDELQCSDRYLQDVWC